MQSFFSGPVPLLPSSLNLDLLEAARLGKLEKVKSLIALGADINVQARTPKYFGYTPLIHASRGGHADVVNWILFDSFLAVNLTLQTRFNNRNTALHWSAREGHDSIAESLLAVDSTALFIQEDQYGYTPLHWAVRNHHTAVVAVILERAEKLDHNHLLLLLNSHLGKTVFQMALDYHYTDIIEKFYQFAHSTNNKAALRIVDHYQKVKQKSRNLMGMVLSPLGKYEALLLEAAKTGDENKLQEALHHGVNINARDVGTQYGNYTPLIHAARRGHVKIVKILLAKNAATKLRTCQHNTALHWAAREGRKKIVELLLVDPQVLFKQEKQYGYTPLHWAALNGHEEVCALLINKGAANLLVLPATDGSTPIHLAIAGAHFTLARKLLLLLQQEDGQNEELISKLEIHLNFVSHLASVDDISFETLKNSWCKANEQEYLIMDDLLKTSQNNMILEQILKGGHLVLFDGGYYYHRWIEHCQQKCNRQNASSHYSFHDQYSIQGTFVKECLFGTIEKDGKLCTWIQLESHPIGLKHLMGHLAAYCCYKVSGRNQGPYGSSEYTDRNYMQIDRPTKARIEEYKEEIKPQADAHEQEKTRLTYSL